MKLNLVSIIAISALLAIAEGNCCFAGPPIKNAAADANSFAALAKEIEKSVLMLGYPKSTSDDLVKLVRSWKCELWKQKLSQTRVTSGRGQAAEVARVEEEVVKGLYMALEKGFAKADDHKIQYYHLTKVLEDKKAQCVGFTQLFYILGTATGLSVNPIEVLELVSGPLPPRIGHIACLVSRSDGKVMIVDVAMNFLSKPFVFKTAYAEGNNCWQIKDEKNPLKVYPRHPTQEWE